MKLSMPNKHLIFESHRENNHNNLFEETKNALNSLVLKKIQNYMLLYQNFQMHDIRINVSG